MSDIIVAEDNRRVSAQVPVNSRVSSNAKRVKALIADDVLPAMIKAIKHPNTSPETVCKLSRELLQYHQALETLAENTLTDRLRIELQAFGPNVKAKEVKPVAQAEEDDDQPWLTNDIIPVE